MGMTNKCGLDWLIGFIDHSFTIICNHSKLQQLTINLQLNPSSLTAEESLCSDSPLELF
jgi:hypothetical protein